MNPKVRNIENEIIELKEKIKDLEFQAAAEIFKVNMYFKKIYVDPTHADLINYYKILSFRPIPTISLVEVEYEKITIARLSAWKGDNNFNFSKTIHTMQVVSFNKHNMFTPAQIIEQEEYEKINKLFENFQSIF